MKKGEKETIVISLGGSLIIPDKINYKFLHKFKSTIRQFYPHFKFVVVCGGGSIARKYISLLEKENKTKYQLSQAGIRATRMNALFMMQFFGKEANNTLPKDMKEVKDNLKKNNIVFCGALRYVSDSTSDSTAAKLSHYLNSKFINMTNVSGLYNKNPKTSKNTKLIPFISWKDFEKLANKMKYKAGQHFVLDQKASIIIRKHKIPTFILGPELKNLEKVLNNKSFKGTLVSN